MANAEKDTCGCYTPQEHERPGHAAEKDALDLDAITDKWLLMCPPCDGGLSMGCTHPGEDYRPVMLSLVREIERLRARVLPPGSTEADQ